MELDRQTGIFSSGVRYLASPNCDERPDEDDINLLVIHGISLPPDEFGGPWIDQLFTNQLQADEHPYFAEIHQLEVSSHLLIRRDGEIVQYVPIHKRAWHAGVSSFEGRERCNDYAIGIELEGTDTIPYEGIQYRQLARVTKIITACYPDIEHNRIVGHSDIAPGRKTDPGPVFDWAHYFTLLDEPQG
jgi:AmpD protein